MSGCRKRNTGTWKIIAPCGEVVVVIENISNLNQALQQFYHKFHHDFLPSGAPPHPAGALLFYVLPLALRQSDATTVSSHTQIVHTFLVIQRIFNIAIFNAIFMQKHARKRAETRRTKLVKYCISNGFKSELRSAASGERTSTKICSAPSGLCFPTRLKDWINVVAARRHLFVALAM